MCTYRNRCFKTSFSIDMSFGDAYTNLQMLISILLATYNGEKYLREQLDSILNQTIQDYEIIVCDDCSMDSTIDILNTYSMSDDRFKIYHNETNMGFINTFQKMIGLAKGEYLAFSDQDDVWYPDHLEKLYLAIKDSKYDVVGGGSRIVDERLVGSCKFLPDNYALYPYPNRLYSTICDMGRVQGAAMMVKRDFCIFSIPIPDGINYHDIWMVNLSVANNCFLFIRDTIIDYRMHTSNVSGNTKGESFYQLLKRKCNEIRSGYIKYRTELYLTERIHLCRGILERSVSLPEESKLIIGNCLNYFESRKMKNKFKALFLFFTYHKYMYPLKSNRMFFMRIVDILIN